MSEKSVNNIKFYTLDNILKMNAQYNMIFGERSNGKTYAALAYGVKRYVEHGEQMAYIRRWHLDFRGKRGDQMFNALVDTGYVSEITGGKYSGIYYYSGRWYLSYFDVNLNKRVRDEEPFAYGFALTEMEHDKSTSYNNVTTVVFDEFLTRTTYIPDEFVMFMNVLSTIIRHRDNVKIFMLGNTVNKYCPYFAEMGLSNILKMEKGKIDVYTYGKSDLRVAVEYADSPNKEKPSDFYFAFNNPKLHMITGGEWEIDIYPHLLVKYKPNEVIFKYFIQFEMEMLQCDIVQIDSSMLTYIHRKTSPLKDEDNDIVFTLSYDYRPNYFRDILHPRNDLSKKILFFYKADKVFYQDNEVGEMVRNYMLQCKNLQMLPS